MRVVKALVARGEAADVAHFLRDFFVTRFTAFFGVPFASSVLIGG